MNDQKNLIEKHFGLRGIALFEAGKGVLAMMVAIWLLSLLHKDIQNVGARHVTSANLHLWIAGTLFYATIRFAEATGLWLEKPWAEWFALISGGLYIPIEIYELTHHATALKWVVFALNLVIVVYLARLLRDSHRNRMLQQATVAPQTEP
jgi:uncharacterized membrane protein (DUF2068 family)